MPNQTPTADDIRTQLERTLGSPDFDASDRLKRFLRYVVEETLAGRAGRIKAYAIALDVFGRGPDFDPVTDPIVRVEAGKLRSRLDHYNHVHGKDNLVLIEVPKGGYVPIFHLNRPADAASPADVGRPFAPVERSLPAQPPSVAVLPFANLGSTTEQDYFVDGLTEEITVGLTRFQELNVIGSYSTRPFKMADANIREVAQSLRARFVLHGSVQVERGAIRVIAQLTDAVTGTNIWAERFDGDLTVENLFTIQDEITQQVVARTAGGFGHIKRVLFKESCAKPPDSLEVYDAILRYHHWVPTFSPERYTQARLALEHAVEEDPDYPIALAMLADVYASDYQLGYGQVDEPLERSMRLARAAISLDPNCQTAHWAQSLNYFLLRERENFEQAINQVVALNPANTYMLVSTGLLVGMAGDGENGLDLMTKAVLLNPCSPSWHHLVPFVMHYRQEKYRLALHEALQVNTPECFWEPLVRAAVFGKLGAMDEAANAVAGLLAMKPDFPSLWRQLLPALFYLDDTVAAIRDGLARAGLDL